jgi:hypothetical protein
MSKYLIEFTRFEASIICEFNEKGLLSSLSIDYGKMEQQQIVYLLQNIPVDLPRVTVYSKTKNVKVTDVPADISFNAFWSKYNYKVGKKARAETMWNALTNESKVKALNNIAKYTQWLAQHPTIEKQYPTTYLSNEQWEN